MADDLMPRYPPPLPRNAPGHNNSPRCESKAIPHLSVINQLPCRLAAIDQLLLANPAAGAKSDAASRLREYPASAVPRTIRTVWLTQNGVRQRAGLVVAYSPQAIPATRVPRGISYLQLNLSPQILIIEQMLLRSIIRARRRAASKMRSVVGWKSHRLRWESRNVLVRYLTMQVPSSSVPLLLRTMRILTPLPSQRRPDGINLYFTHLFPGARSALALLGSYACAGILIG